MHLNGLDPRPHLLFHHPRTHRGGGGQLPGHLLSNYNIFLHQGRTRNLGCFESNHTRFWLPYVTFWRFQAGRNQRIRFLVPNSFFANDFLANKDREMLNTIVFLVLMVLCICILNQGIFSHIDCVQFRDVASPYAGTQSRRFYIHKVASWRITRFHAE